MLSIKTFCNSNPIKYLLKSIELKNIKHISTESRLKTIEFKTCQQLYPQKKKKNPQLYRKSPDDGLVVSVDYLDTYADKDLTTGGLIKTIVAIHGIPGYYHHFNELIEFFDKNNDLNVRLIVPNMPDFSLTRKTMAFFHSNQERSQLLRDFFKAINVSTIDCLISHSAGIHPISVLWSDPQELFIKSIGLFCPQPLWLSKYFFNMSQLFSLFTLHKVGIGFMDQIRPHLIAHKMGYPMSYANVDEVLLTVLIGSNGLDQHLLHQRLEYIKNNRIPTLVVYGQRDKLILKRNFELLVQDLGADQKDFTIYSEDNQIEKHCERQEFVKVLSFKSGGHFCFAKYSEEVNKHLVKHCLQL